VPSGNDQAPSTIAIAQDANPPGGIAAPTEADVAKRVVADVAFRQVAGLRADPAYVRSLVEHNRLRDAPTEVVLGTVVTPEEASELRTRLALQDDVSSVVSYGLSHPESYAGLYIDPKKGVASVLFTGDLAPHQAALSSFPMADRLVFRPARWTLADLESAAANLSREMPELSTTLGVAVTSVGVDPEDNAVHLGVDQLTAQVETWISQQFPEGKVVAVQQSPVTPTSGVVGGGWVDGPSSSCTVGFNFHDSHGTPGFFSAGHCFNAGDTVTPRALPSQHYTVYGWASGGSTDSLVVPTNPGDGTNQAGWITVSAAAGLNDDPPGKYICYYGAAIGTQHCGSRVNSPVTVTLYSHGENRTIYNVREVDMGCWNQPVPGDSGSPVYSSDSHAYGILMGVVPTLCNAYMAYTHVQYAMSTWGVTVPY
jgi:hypothetical protein